jgi:hypothetical protein
MNTAASETPVEAILTPAVIEAPQPPDSRLCSNPRCKKGPDGTPGIIESRRAKYCCRYCRMDVCRRNRPKPEQVEKPKRKRRSDAKWKDHSERQRAYQRRNGTAHLPQGIKDLLWMRDRRAGVGAIRVQEPA